MRAGTARCLPARVRGVSRGSRAARPVAGHGVRDPAGHRTSTRESPFVVNALQPLAYLDPDRTRRDPSVPLDPAVSGEEMAEDFYSPIASGRFDDELRRR